MPYAGSDVPLEEIRRVIEICKPISIQVTGGEPTLHEHWLDLIPILRSAGCALTVFTNGWGFTRYPDSFLIFTQICASDYSADSASNADDIAFIRKFLAEKGQENKLVIAPVYHQPRPAKPVPPVGCLRGSNSVVGFMNGKLYGCCVAAGIEGGIGVNVTQNWRKELFDTELPCQNCMFNGQ